ncbi:MAG: DUF169 domain-containing protein [Chloroflexota bacterium]|nr:DUF169 domain-containing protein [Chloroflexota bacterium]
MTTAPAVGVSPDAPPEPDSYDWPGIVAGLQRYLRLTATPVGMKMFETIEEMQEVERIRRPQFKHALDQLVAQSRWLNFTLGVTMDDLIGAQCGAPVGLHPNEDDGEWRLRTTMSNVWFETDEDSILHQQAMDVMPYGRYAALALSPLATGRLDPPDVVLLYGTPGQMIILINGLQFSGFKKFEFASVGESACADSWGRALRTGEPSLSIPCYAERRFGGVQDDELLMAIPPRYLPKLLDGLDKLSRNGLRYPIPPLGIQADPSESLARSYQDRF